MQCSEPFYKSTVLDQIAADPKADFDEKKRMLDMLRRFEDSQAEGEDSLRALEEDDESEDELERALAGVNLGTPCCCLPHALGPLGEVPADPRRR